jgi:ferrochelatase
VKKIVLLPLYPQYSASTTASTFDKVADILKTWRAQPALQYINQYYENPSYIEAIAKSIENYWSEYQKTQKLLFSFHGLPKKFVEKGDPYEKQCRATASAIAKRLALRKDEWNIAFQSRLGKASWLTPYTDKVLHEWGTQNVKSVTVVCPGFSVDCLETLEEINLQNRKIFLNAGGENFHYVPALNDSELHINMLCKLIEEDYHHSCGKLNADENNSDEPTSL